MSAQTVVPGVAALKKLSLEDLMDLQVTSVSRSPEKLFDAAAAIQVVTRDDIQRSGASSIPEALRLAGNLHVVQKGSHAWGISARGFNTELANKLLVLMDGRTIYTPLFSGVFWDRQDYLLEDLDRIEVISGPGGALWGANAVNGVINILSKNARDTQGWFVETGGGSTLRGFAGVRYGGMLAPDVSFRVYGKYVDRDGEVFGDGSDAGDSWHMGQGGFRIDAGGSSRDHLTLQGDLYRGTENVVTGGVSRTRGGNLLGRWTRTFSDESDLSLQLYYDQTHLVLPTPPFVLNGIPLAPAGTLTDDLDTYDLDFQHRFRWGEHHRVVWGLGYRFTHDTVVGSPSLTFVPSGLDQDLYSGFVQDEIGLRDDVSLTVGTKIEHNDYTGWEVEPSVRLQWGLTGRQMIWGAVSRAIRAPSRVDRDLAQGALPTLVVLAGGPDFDSEVVVAYEAGYRAQLGPQLALAIATFYNFYDDVRSTGFTPATIIPFFFANNLEGETYGAELSADLRVGDYWRLRAGYNLLREDIRIKPGEMDLNNALNETGDPRHQFSLHSSLDLPAHWELDAGLRWVDSFIINNGGSAAMVPSYWELDVRLGWQVTEAIELSVVGQNLLHPRHPEYGAPSATRQEISRSVYGRAAWRF